MCGITLCVAPADVYDTDATWHGHEEPNMASSSRPSFSEVLHSLHSENARRGPDASGVYGTQVHTPAGTLRVSLGAAVLGLRGTLTPQPLVGERGVLAWNGQVFAGLDVAPGENDTRALFTRLEAGDDPAELFARVEGPFAFVYVEFATSTIHFGLDPLSRRSLLLHSGAAFILTSARSATARAAGLDMRALDGGYLGVLNLKAVRLIDGVPDYTAALRTWTRTPLLPVNPDLAPRDDEAADPAERECSRFVARLQEAVDVRVQTIPLAPAGTARVALLFSGGVDCSLLAALVHRALPAGEPIELVNVAFEQPRKGGNNKGKGKEVAVDTYATPDRASGLAAADELRASCPGREWRFVAVDVPLDESRAHRQAVVDLMYPSKTEMDVSLAYPLYFAARGVGSLVAVDGPRARYRATARVYLSGLGADEQLAGYTRHRRAFERGGRAGLAGELQLDLDRIPQRNLSRDDRMLAGHARDARYPFLDLAFVDYVSGLPLEAKCDLTCPPGTGDKRLIRLAAASCGLVETSARVKRAMQFGTKSAKLNEAASSKGRRVGEGFIQECL